MRLDNPIQVDMVLGDGARDRGARADHISELTPGVAYVRVEGSRELRRVRSAYLDDEAIVNLAESLQAEGMRIERNSNCGKGSGVMTIGEEPPPPSRDHRSFVDGASVLPRSGH